MRVFVQRGSAPRLLLLLFVCMLLAVGQFASAGQFNEVISIGDSMPGFNKLPTVEGRSISARDLDEDIVVLVSMSNNCPFSRGIENDLIDFVDSVKGQSVRVVAMSFNLHNGDQMPAMKQHARDKGFNFTYLRDTSQELGRALGTAVTPEFFVFGKNDGNQGRKLLYMGLMHNSPPMIQGNKVVYPRGEPTEFYLADAIRALQQGDAVKQQETRAFGCSVEYAVDKYEK